MGLFRIEISKRRLILAKHLHFGIGYQTFGYRFFPEVPYWWVEADLRSCRELGFDALITQVMCLMVSPKALVREEATVLCLWWIFATPTVSKQPSPEVQENTDLFWCVLFSALCGKCQKPADRMRSRFF